MKRLDLVAEVMALDGERLHQVLCALWPDDTHAARAAAVMAEALRLRHPVVGPGGEVHAVGGRRHEAGDWRHRVRRMRWAGAQGGGA